MRKFVEADHILQNESLRDAYIQDSITRQASHGQLRALWSQMEHMLGYSMERFRLPRDMNLRPCVANEVRVRARDGSVLLFNTVTNEKTLAFAAKHYVKRFYCLTQITDRGSILQAGLHLMLSQEYTTFPFVGFFHNQWNALKMSSKKNVASNSGKPSSR